MDDRLRALLGAALLVAGLFAPIVELPIAGSMNYVENGRGDGALILLLALGSAWLAWRGRLRPLLWTGLAGAALVLFTLGRFLLQAVETRERLQHGLGGAFAHLAERATQPVMPQWGIALLVAGLMLLVHAGWRARR